MDEATKTRKLYPELISKYISGKIVDIGAGSDKISEDALIFDLQDGDAQYISKHFERDSFDTVFSSHCLEHVVDPDEALKDWIKILKPGGIIFILVPEEDLYEQGHFPSIFNSDHKSTFTISKSASWSPRSFNIYDLATKNNLEILHLTLQNNNYDLTLRSFKKIGLYRIPYSYAVIKKFSFIYKLSRKLRLIPIDQTAESDSTLAQICLIARKR